MNYYVNEGVALVKPGHDRRRWLMVLCFLAAVSVFARTPSPATLPDDVLSAQARPLRNDRTILPDLSAEYAAPAQFVHRRETVKPVIAGLNKPLTQEWIKKLSTPAKLKWLAGVLQRGEPYMAFIRRELQKRGMPEELVYLPVVESEFFIDAKSRSGAAGIWQFMPNSVKPFMEMDEWVDERYDFWKSTQAALAKLQGNYTQFHDWALALAAYNAGAGYLARTLKATGARDYWQLSALPAMKADTRQYVPKLLAIAYIAANPREAGMEVPWHAEVKWARIPVESQVNLALLAEEAGLDKKAFLEANSELLRGVTPPGRQHFIKVQNDDYDAVNEALKRSNATLVEHRAHVVARGETLYSIALRYGVTLDSITALNRDINVKTIHPGDTVRLPPLAAEEAALHNEEGANGATLFTAVLDTVGETIQNATAADTHTVRAGDTLYSLAKKYGVTVAELAARNNIMATGILKPGMKLRIR